MKGKALSDALNGLPEEMLAEAMEPAKHRRNFSWLRLAACIALIVGLFFGVRPNPDGIVTAPGLLSVKVYAMGESGEGDYIAVQTQKGISVRHENYTPLALNIWPGIPVQFDLKSDDHDLEKITFQISVSSGEYCGEDWHEISDQDKYFSLNNQSRIFWDITTDDYGSGTAYDSKYDHVYTNIIIYEGEHIIGYTILRFDRLYGKEFKVLCPALAAYYDDDEPVMAYYSTIVESVKFPKVRDVFQDISFDLVESLMEEQVQNDLRQFNN